MNCVCCKPTAEIAHFSTAALVVLVISLFGARHGHADLANSLALAGMIAFSWTKELSDWVKKNDSLDWALTDVIFYMLGAIAGCVAGRWWA